MYPENQNQRPANRPESTPPAAQPQSNGNPWDFLYSQPEVAKKKTFFQEYKKLIIVASSAVILLIILGVVAALSPSQTTEQNGTGSTLQVPTTNVKMNRYEGQYFSAEYPSSLKINIDESLGQPEGWFLHFAEDPEFKAYDIAIQAGQEASGYETGGDAVEAFLAGQEQGPPGNVYTAGAVVAGVDGLKTVGEYSDSEGTERYVIYATAEVNGKNVIVNGTYPKSNQDIVDSIDVLIASIRLN